MTLYAIDGMQPVLPKDNSFWIADDANVIGNVVLQEGVSIWFGATIRGDNEVINIGTGSNVQENSVLHTDIGYPLIIGKNCTISNGVQLGPYVSVGDNCNLKQCSIQDSIIMTNCIINVKSNFESSIISHGSEITASDIPKTHQFLLGERSQIKL